MTDVLTGLGSLRTSTLVVGLVAFLAVLGAYVGLVLAGQDTGGLLSLVVTLGGLLGVGTHGAVNAKRQQTQLAKIDKQTNGVLTQRIEDGVRKVLAEGGVINAPVDRGE